MPTPPRFAQSVSSESALGVKFAGEAVIIFFVLSGYLVGGSVLRALKLERWSWKGYLSKRLTRLWVPLIPCLIICVCLDRFGFHRSGAGSIYDNPPGIDLVISNGLIDRLGLGVFLGNVCFLQGIFVHDAGTNVSLWSLANEFWYYLAFPCLVLAASSQRPPLRRLLYGAFAVGILLFIGRGMTSLFPIWLTGAAVTMVPWRLPERTARWLAAGFLPLLLMIMLGARISPLGTLVTEYIVGAAASIFLYLLVQQRSPSRDSAYKNVAKYFSEVSYTLYIAHLPIAVFLASLVNSPWYEWEKTPANLLLFLALDGLVLLLATLLWRLFEANTDAVRQAIFERS